MILPQVITPMRENFTPVEGAVEQLSLAQIREANSKMLREARNASLAGGFQMTFPAATIEGTYAEDYEFLVVRRWKIGEDLYLGGINGEVLNLTVALAKSERYAVDYQPEAEDEMDVTDYV